MRSIIAGRAETCDIVVDNVYVSARHCRITQDDSGQYWVQDLGSTNGTFIRSPGGNPPGTRVYHRELIPSGYRIWLGSRVELPWDM